MMDETKTVPISYTKFGADVSRLDELLVIKPEKFLCYSESFYLKPIESLFYYLPLLMYKNHQLLIATTS
jgi:hypothetical protein